MNNVGNIIGAVLVVGLAGTATFLGIRYFREQQQGYAALGPAAQPPPQQQNIDMVRTGTAPQQPQPGDNTAAQVQAWGNVVLNLFGQAKGIYDQYWGS